MSLAALDLGRSRALSLDGISPAPTPRCLGCDYVLLSVSDGRCPECGKRFDSKRPNTMNRTGHPIPASLRRMLKPIGGFTVMVATLAAVATFWTAMMARHAVESAMLACVLWALAWGLAINKPLQHLLLLRLNGWAYSSLPMSIRRLLIVPVLTSATIITCATPLPATVSFWLSRADLEQQITGPAAPAAGMGPAAVAAGVLDPVFINQVAEGEWLVFLGTGDLQYGYYGFMYSASGQVPAGARYPGAGSREFIRLSEHWFLCQRP